MNVTAKRTSRLFLQGFTLIELLVVIGIIALLMALLLPAIQSARARAQEAQCLSKMKQLGIALQAYHDKFNGLPFGYMCGSYICNDQDGCSIDEDCDFEGQAMDYHWSGWSMILPDLEGGVFFDDMNTKLDRLAEANITATTAVLGIYLCPAQYSGTVLTDEYSVDFNTDGDSWTFLGQNAPSSYRLSMAGAINPEISDRDQDFNNGCFYRNSRVSLASISNADGASRTILFGEVARDPCGPNSIRGLFGCGHRDNGYSSIQRTYRDFQLNQPTKQLDSTGDGVFDMETFGYWSSRHSSVVHFGMADGHTQAISISIDRDVMKALATREGRETISDGSF